MKKLLLISSLSLISTPILAQSNPNITSIDAAANSMNIAILQQLSDSNQDYNRAYAHYRLAISANIMGQKSLASESLNSAQTVLEALSQSQANAESLALLSSVYGMKIALDPSQGVVLGMKSAKAIASAEQLAPPKSTRRSSESHRRL